MIKVTTFTARCVAVPFENIDTDQIAPARYLKITDKSGLGDALFAAWRQDPAFALNQPAARGAGVLVAGHNFGCGSSREHAPWALLAYGFRAVISTYFADIFKANALKNGLLPIVVAPAVLDELVQLCAGEDAPEITVDLAGQRIVIGGRAVPFPIDAFARHCLLHGVDQLGYLRGQEERIAAYEAANPARIDTRAAGASA